MKQAIKEVASVRMPFLGLPSRALTIDAGETIAHSPVDASLREPDDLDVISERVFEAFGEGDSAVEV